MFLPENKIDKDLLKDCIETGKKLLNHIFKDFEELVQCRIDFACCLNNDKRCREFFINEIEVSPTIGTEKYEKDGIGYSLLARRLIHLCK